MTKGAATRGRCPDLSFLLAAALLFTAFLSPARADDTGDTAKQIVETPISAAPTYAKRALVIGIDNYEYVHPLTVCANDAQEFAQLLQSKFGFENVTLMTDKPGTPDTLKPTFTNIIHQLGALENGTVPGQTQIVLYFSGHGTRTKNSATGDADWLIPLDGDPNEVSLTCINYTAFKSDLETKLPARALLIMDACRDIDPAKGTDMGSGFGGVQVVLGPQIAELLSCEPTQVSREGLPKDFKESVFTHFLIAGLEGDRNALASGTNYVTFDSLKLYLQGAVSDYVSRNFQGAAQTPDGDAKFGSMVLENSNEIPSVVRQFVLPPNTNVTPYTDVPPDHWAYSPVRNLQLLNILPGYPDGTFGGRRAMTRYESADAFYRLANHFMINLPGPELQGIKDIEKDGNVNFEVEPLVAAKVFSLYPDKSFGGRRATTRYEAACAFVSIINRVPALKSLAASADQHPLPSDVPPNHWAVASVRELESIGITSNYKDGTFEGRRAITRYEFAVWLSNLVSLIQQQSGSQ